MTALSSMTRRAFLAMAGTLPVAATLAQGRKLMVGLELFSVRGELMKDLFGTVRAVAKMGYEVVEFFAPYYLVEQEGSRFPELETAERCLATFKTLRG